MTIKGIRAPLAIVTAALLGCAAESQQPSSSEPQTAQEWLQRAEASLSKASSAQWNLTLDVEKPLGLFQAGKHDYTFQVRGAGRVHWTEEHPAGGERVHNEAWYDGETIYFRNSLEPKRLGAAKFGEDEGECVRLSMIRGGVVGWVLVHATMLGNLQTDQPKLLRFERYRDRPAVVVEYAIKLEGVCGTSENLPGCRLWIDRERLLPLKREYAMLVKAGGSQIPFVGTEVFSSWTLNAAIEDAAFETEGMVPPSARVTLPQDPVGFEEAMTERLHGIVLKPLPGRGGSTGFSTLKDTVSPKLTLAVQPSARMADPNTLQDDDGIPAPTRDRPMSNAVARKTSKGEIIEAWDGLHGDLGVESTEWCIEETTETLRHRYKGRGGYVGFSAYIGTVTGSKIRPALTFRDPGFQSSGPLDMVFDDQDRCHLLLIDRDPSQGDRLRILYLVGDLVTHRWIEGWILHECAGPTSCMGVSMVRDGATLWIAWSQDSRVKSRDTDGVYCIGRTASGFTEKLRVATEAAEQVALARDSKGMLMLVWRPSTPRTKEQLLACVRTSQGTWSTSAELSMGYVSMLDGLGLYGSGEGRFRLRLFKYKGGWRKEGLFGSVPQADITASVP